MKKIFGYGKKNEKGITLTALVITVVVLSAIAAVGLKAADSEIKSVNEIQNEAQKQEDKLENTGKQINKMYDDLDIKDVDLTAEIKQTTCSFEISKVQLQNSSEIIGRYKYFIKEKDSSSYREISSTKDNFMTMDKLRHNTQYDIKIEVYNQSGKKIKTSVKTAKTNELTAGSLTLKHTDANGDVYTVNTWTKDSIYVALTKGSAGTTTYESISGSAQTVAAGTTAATTVTTNGTTTLRVKTTDGMNTVYSQEYIIKIDKEAPTNAAPTVNATTNSLTVTNKQIDNLSGIASVQYAIYKGNSWSAWQTSNQFTGLIHNTTYKVKTKTTDKVGNASESAENTTAKTSNLVAGTLTLTHNTASGSAYTSNTWTKDSVYVALVKASTGTTTYESITGSAQSVGSGTTADTTVNTNGTTTLRVKTTDGTNTVYNSNYVIKVDKAKPTAGTLTMKLGSSTGNAYTSNSWTNQNVWLHKNDGSDTLSGHKSTTYTVSGANLTNQTADNTISVEGKYTATVTTYDNVDNSSTNSYNVKIDKTAPTTTAPTATSTTNGITVTFKQTDSLSGINASTKQYAIYKNGAWSAWQTSNEFTGVTYNTSYKVKTKVSDNAGNSSESTELSISTKNLTAPTLSFKLENNSGSDYTVGSWVGKNVYVTLNKATSGTSTYESLQGSAQTVAATTAATTISTSGTTTLRAKVTDGTNTIYSNNYVVKVDKNAPTNVAPTATSTTNSISVASKQTDNLSGLNSSTLQYAIYKGNSWSAWQASNTFTGLTHNTAYKVKTKVSDNVGNTSESTELSISTKQLTAGGLTLKHTNSSGAAYTANTWTKDNVYVTLNKAASGTSTYESVSGSAQTVAVGTTADTTVNTNGTTTLRVKTTDGTNTVYSGNYIIKKDAQNPTAGTLTMKLNNSSGGAYTSGKWTNQSVWLHKNDGSDTLSGHKSTTYTVASTSITNQTADNTISTEGKYTATVTTYDNVSNSSTRNYTINIDKTAPTTIAPGVKTTTNSITISSKQTDALSGIASVQYALYNGSSWSSWQSSNTFTGLTTNKVYKVKTKTTDKAGNSSESIEASATTTNLTAGTLTMKLGSSSGGAYTSGTWTNQNVYVTLNKATTGTTTYLSTDSSAQTVAETASATTINKEGTSILKVKTTDGINTAYSSEYTIKIDKTAPTTAAPTASKTTKSITITCKQTDGLSGINASTKQYAIYKDGAWSAWQTSNVFNNLTSGKEYQVKTKVSDNAGNSAESTATKVTTTTLTAGTLNLKLINSTGANYTAGTWTNQNVYVTLNNGSAGTTTYASVSGSAQSVASTTGATTIEAAGTTTLKVTTTDGTNSVSNTYVIKIDKTAPTAGTLTMKLNSSTGAAYTANTWTANSIHVHLNNGSDETNGSGHKSTSYSITGPTTASGTNDVTLTTTGTYTAKITTTDNAGNSATRTVTIKIDKEKPATPTITNAKNNTWTNDNVTVTIKSSDNHSGIDRIEWYENNAWTTRALTTTNGTGTISYTANRNETVRFRAVDKVGNVSAEATTIVKIDKTAPTNTAPTATVTAQSITVTCKQTDSLSGIKSGTTQYALKTGDTWSAWQTSNTFTKLKQSTSYVVKTKVTDNAGNSAESSETTVYTSKLAAGTLTLKYTDASGATYTSNTWTKDNVYVTLNNGSAGTTTYASVSGSAQSVASTTGATTIEAAGTTTLKVTTTDGTNTSTNSYIIKIDKTAPTVGTLTMKLGSSTGTTYTSGNWTNQNVWVHKNDGSDSQSGHKSTTYTISAASLTNQTADNTLTKEGKYTAVVTTTDNVSNSSTKNYNINIDKTAPTTVAPTASQTTNSITVTNKQTDALSGVSSTQYAIYNGSSWSSWQSSNVFSGLTTNKTYKVKTKTTDKAGNSSESAELSVTTSNLTAGSLTLKHTNASGTAYTANTWTKDSVYATLNNGSAGTTTYTSVSGSAQTVAVTSSATTITTSGTTKLVVTTTDGTNTAKSGEYIIKVDKNAPTNTAPTTSATTNSVTVTCKQTDSLSGINASTTQYAIYKGSSWSAWQTSNKFTGLTHNTSYKVKTKISDNVGNSGESAETTVSTSKLAAGSLTLKHTNASGAAYTSGSWSTTDIYVTLTRASTGTTTYESISGSAQTVATGTTAATTVTTAGTTTLRVKTTDGTNTVYSSNYVIKIDKTKPTAGTMTMKLGSSSGSTYTSGTWTNQSVYIALNNGSDETGGSGHSSTTYSISGAATQSNQTAAQTLTAAGKYTITITTKDVAGNSSTRTQYIYIDKTKPTAGTLTMKLDSSTGSSYSNNTWTNHSVYISLNNGSDETNGSGHSSTTYSISGSATQSNQTAAQTLSATGTYNITVTTKDKAGNTSTNNYVIKIDKKAPNVGTLTMKLDSASGENYTNDTWTNHNIYIAVNNGNDANSGHQSTTYSISGPITVTNSSEARTLTAEGTYTVVLTTKDNVGNSSSRTYTIKLKFPHVGEYVNYKPDTPNTGYNLRSAQSGYNTNQIIDTSYDPTEWRIMEVDENRRITKLFGVPNNNQKSISFGGARGYNNGVLLLNIICEYRYSNSNLGAVAKSLTIEDIESWMSDDGISARDNYKSGTVQYGTTRRYTGSFANYPSIYAQEKYSGVGVNNIIDGTQIINDKDNKNSSAKSKMNPNGRTQSNPVYIMATENDSTGPTVTSLTCTQTLYGGDQLVSYYKDSNFYNMIYGTGTSFWLASRDVDCSSDYINSSFGFRDINNSTLGAYYMFSSNNYNGGTDKRIAPVVAFESTINIVGGNGSKNNPYTISKGISIGDYVKYEPDIPTAGYELSSSKSGYSNAQTIDKTYDPTSWRIMELDNDGNITKIFGVPSSSQNTVYFSGTIGYNNGVYLLNDICKKRYGNANLGATARHLNIEDLESEMNESGKFAKNSYKAGTIQYGTTKKYSGRNAQYPEIYAQEKYSGVNVSDILDGTQVITSDANKTAQSKLNPGGKTESDNIYTALPATSKTAGQTVANLTSVQTYYGNSQLSLYYNTSIFYNMIFGTGTKFWLASRFIYCISSDSFAHFGIRNITNEILYGNELFFSNGNTSADDNRLAPVVSLNLGIKAKSGSGTESDPYIIGK